MEKPQIKVCGMRMAQNIIDVATLQPDMMGFIFFPGSKRYVGEGFDVPIIPEKIEKVGVFVNEDSEKIICTLEISGFQTAQLHGSETAETCRMIRNAGFKVLKAFGIDENFKWETLQPYLEVTDGFVFDTKTEEHGGSGKKFNWEILNSYTYTRPFLLSGGIKPEDTEILKSFDHPQCAGFDINSGFETSPAVKDINKIEQFINQLRK